MINDLSHMNININDKSLNDIDDRRRQVVSSVEMNSASGPSHHNLSISNNNGQQVPNTQVQSHGSTLRQNSKRINSQERGKMARPRSSKGYRGNTAQ